MAGRTLDDGTTHLVTTDNTTAKSLQLAPQAVDDLAPIAVQTIAELRGDNPSLLAFPYGLDTYRSGEDKAETLRLFSLHPQEAGAWSLATGNVMGFVGRNNTQLTITSRFAKDDAHDFFLHHMLHKVFRLNIVNFQVRTDLRDNIYDFLLYLFPSHLMPAMRQGLYKEYRRIKHNDANVKGAIDVARHLKRNIPFAGKIAYNTREYRYDNAVTQLVRHTIEHIKAHPWGRSTLRNSTEMSDAVNQIEFHTLGYNRNERGRVINANLTHPVTHPYFTEWRRLQQLCLRILRHDKLTYGREKGKVYGLIFDGAWLWEEYLDVMFREIGEEIKHPCNKERKGRDTLFKDGQEIYPDFIKVKEPDGKNVLTAHFVADAKYKRIDKRGEEASREDYYQVTTYMYRYECNRASLLFPYDGDDKSDVKDENGIYKKTRCFLGARAHQPAENADCKRCLFELGLPVPQGHSDFKEFATEMDAKAREGLGWLVSQVNEKSE
ncbi:MAG: McrC family protein [Kiritimatiellia bacterium]|jgi:5-methylcytosine-specific restriction endonuclease McrBC regulatory subunit McrC